MYFSCGKPLYCMIRLKEPHVLTRHIVRQELRHETWTSLKKHLLCVARDRGVLRIVLNFVVLIALKSNYSVPLLAIL